MVSLTLIRACFVLSTLYTIVLLALFIVKKDFVIQLTYRTPTYRWGELQQLMRDHPLTLPQNELNTLFVSWCPRNPDPLTPTPASPQCSCINNFYFTFMNNSAAFLRGEGPTDLAALGDLQAKGVLDACLSQRTTWRKDTCAHLCQMHLAVPVLIATLCMSLFFSRITEYRSGPWAMLSAYLPILLAVVVIVMNLVADALGSVSAVWSFQRFFMGSIAVWAAVTHQGRDLYVLSAYAALGFFIGMLAYTEYIMRFKQGCNKRMRIVSIYVWVGICVITASLFLLIQQHWYTDSPVWSSLVSVACLMFACMQCVAMVPGIWISDTLQLAIGLSLFSVSVLTVGVDMLAA
jgi:hypothetical protein